MTLTLPCRRMLSRVAADVDAADVDVADAVDAAEPYPVDDARGTQRIVVAAVPMAVIPNRRAMFLLVNVLRYQSVYQFS